MKAWRRKMNAALGAARASAAAGNHAAALNYHNAAMNRANNRGSSATIAAVESQTPYHRGPSNPGPGDATAWAWAWWRWRWTPSTTTSSFPTSPSSPSTWTIQKLICKGSRGKHHQFPERRCANKTN